MPSPVSRPTRLVHIVTVPQTLGFLRGQVGYMHAQGVEVHAISSPGPRLDTFGRNESVTTHAVPISRTISPLRDLMSLVRLFLLLRRLRPVMVSVSTPKAALLGAIAAWLVRVPVRIFLWQGSITEGRSGSRRRLYRFLEQLTALLCHQVVCVSPSLLAFVRREGIVPPSNGVVVADGTVNGIDAKRFDPTQPWLSSHVAALRHQLTIPDHTLVVGFVGRICADKGLDDLAAAWQSFRNHAADPVLLLLGAWEQEDPVSQQTMVVFENDPRVRLVGHVEDIVPYYRLMTVLTLPTRGTEGLPYAPMEASAMELPVVATTTVGCVDAIVDGVTGTLVPPRDPQALSQAIARYLDDPDLRRRHGLAGRERVLRDFRPEDIWEATYQEYVRLLRKKGLAVPEPREARL